MNTFIQDGPDRRDMVNRILRAEWATKAARLNALSAFLVAKGITREMLHSKDFQVFVSTIHNSLTEEDDMKKYIQHIIDNPWCILLDPLIIEIFNGRYLISVSVPEVQWNISSWVDQTLAWI